MTPTNDCDDCTPSISITGITPLGKRPDALRAGQSANEMRSSYSCFSDYQESKDSRHTDHKRDVSDVESEADGLTCTKAVST